MGRVYILFSILALEGVSVVIRLKRFDSFGIDLALESRFTTTDFEGAESIESLDSACVQSRKEPRSEALLSAFPVNFTPYTR